MTISSPALGRPVGANGEETRRRIVAATMRCVAEVGYSRATIREIARAANMTSGSLYHYFPNKAELMKVTFLTISEVAVPSLVAAAAKEDGVLEKLMAVLDQGERLMRDFPHAAAFDRAIRAESAQQLHLAEDSETIFNTLRELIVEILEQARQEGVLGAEITVDEAAQAIYVLLQGLNEHAIATPETYHTTVQALKLLLRGKLFDYTRLAARPAQAQV